MGFPTMMKIITRHIFRSGVTPKDAVKNLTKHLNNLIAVCEQDENVNVSAPDNNAEQKGHVRDKVATDLAQIRFMLLGDPETAPNQEHRQQLVEALLLHSCDLAAEPLCLKILSHIHLYPQDAQKEAATIINYVIRKHNAEFMQTFRGNLQGFVQILLAAYSNGDPRLQIQISSILRELMKNEELHAYLLTGCVELRSLLLINVENPNFDVSSDALTTLNALLTTNKKTVANFLADNCAEFFTEFHATIKSENYVTRRQSLKLLWTVLLDKTNRPTMMRYISDKYNLQLLMMMLLDPSKEIPFEAFQMFKVFVANKNPHPAVYRTLYKNKAKLIDFLGHFQTDVKRQQTATELFTHEKGLLVERLKTMSRTPEEYEAAWKKRSKKAQGAKKVHVK